MKGRKRKKVLAVILCMLLIMGTGLPSAAESVVFSETDPQRLDIQGTETKRVSGDEAEETEPASGAETKEKEQTPEKLAKETEKENTEKKSETTEPDMTELSQPTKSENDSEKANADHQVQSFLYEDEDVRITAYEEREGAIPEKASLRVVPVREKDEATRGQYAEVKERLGEKIKKTVEGFLAYDICFIDQAGEKLETSGDVRISMEYKKEGIPKANSEKQLADTDIALFHLEEDRQGNIKNIADLSEENGLQFIETGKGNAVRKVEFVTDSFSCFVLVWQVDEQEHQVKIHLMDYRDKTPLQNTGEVIKTTFTNGENIDLSELAGQCKAGDGYAFVEARVDSAAQGQAVKKISYNTNAGKHKKWHYIKEERDGKTGSWEEWIPENEGEPEVYLLYDKLETLERTDTEADGIIMTMTDLEGFDKEQNLLTPNPTGESVYLAKTKESEKIKIGGGYEWGMNDENPDNWGLVRQGLVNKILTDGYPVTTGEMGGDAGKNLRPLFADGKQVNRLFKKDADGYYEYSSFENYAYLPEEEKDFKVYRQIGSPWGDVKMPHFQRGNFMPYNAIEAGALLKQGTNQYDIDGNPLTDENPRKGEVLYKSQGQLNYFYGMTLETDFLQPEGGKTDHGKEMIFEFNGDDDLWLFIDDVLVLDIGGIHDAHSGKINFATGEVSVVIKEARNGKQAEIKETTVKACFEEAGRLPDGTQWDDAEIEKFFADDTLKDYSIHTMKIFYLERGAAASNLHMKFNIQTVPKKTVTVEKKLGNTEQGKYADKRFGFQMYVQKKTDDSTNENPEFEEGKYEPLTRELIKKENLFWDASNSGVDWPDGEGKFYLKAGETVRISGLAVNREYFVKEFIDKEEFDGVKVNDTEYTNWDEEGESETIKGVESDTETVQERPKITFTNYCSNANLRSLQITKKMMEGQTTNDTFTFKIQFKNQEGKFVPYNGKYYMKNEEEGYLTQSGTSKAARDGEEPPVYGETTDGTISGIKVGYTVEIRGLLSGTVFRIEEIDISKDYLEPEITVEGVIESGEGSGEGTVQLNQNAKVTVTNQKRLNTLKLEKADNENKGLKLSGAQFKLEKKNGENQWEPVKNGEEIYTVTTDETGAASFENLENGTYKITEIKAPDGYILEEPEPAFEITLPYSQTKEDASIIPDEQNAVTGEQTFYYIVTKTVTNKKQGWQLLKKSSSTGPDGIPLYLKDAEFELKQAKEGGAQENTQNTEAKTYYGKSGENGVVSWYTDPGREMEVTGENPIAEGVYTLRETKAPQGYALSTESWTFRIGQNGGLIEVKDTEGKPIAGAEDDGRTIWTFYFENTPVFELPSAGGAGIFWHISGGILCLLAGVWMLYKNKYKGVLRE